MASMEDSTAVIIKYLDRLNMSLPEEDEDIGLVLSVKEWFDHLA